MIDFRDVTELGGDEVTPEQVERLCHRYYWASQYCHNKDVLEVACGTGQGLGYLAKRAKTLQAGDYSQEILDIAKSYYGDRIQLQQFHAQALPMTDSSIDIVILFEAIYYLPGTKNFLQECQRVLRPQGKILIATANKDLYDFNPSPYSYQYYGVVELNQLFHSYGLKCDFFGYLPISQVSRRQKILRPVKRMAAKLGLIPKTMKGKKCLKKLVFGQLVKMPTEIIENQITYSEPTPIHPNQPDYDHKVIYCVATAP